MKGDDNELLEHFEELLAQIDVVPSELRRDPSGRTWLPSEARALADASDECAAALREFVEDELSLLGAFDQPVAPSSDPFFTARVVQSLPRAWAPNPLTPRRRLLVLGAFYVVAALAALAVVAMVPESTARWAEQAHDVLSWGSDAGSGLWLAAMGVAGVAVAALFAGRLQTPAA